MITASNGTFTRTFTCAQIALAGGLPSGWEELDNTCGRYTNLLRSPFASFGIDLGESARGRWYPYRIVIASNRAMLPPGILPVHPDNVRVLIRRLEYERSTDDVTLDYTINYDDESIDFEATNLNGQVAIIKVFR